MKRERPGHVLQTTALVNEAYLRLIDWKGVSWQNRAHFLGVAAQLMRHILVDFARKRPLAEGEQEAVHVSLDEARLLAPEKSAEVIDKQRVVRRPSRKRVRQPLKRKDLNEKKAEMKVARGEKAGTCEWPTQGRTAHKYTTYRLLSC